MDIKRKLEIAILNIDSIAGHADKSPAYRKAALNKIKADIDAKIELIDSTEQEEINEL